MKKRILAVLMCAAMTATVLAGCGNSTQEAAAPAKEAAPAEELSVFLLAGSRYRC